MMFKSALLILTLVSLDASSEDLSTFTDLNSDGKDDVFYENFKGGYYELTDRDFDGKIDLSSKYRTDGTILSSRYDDDFNGKMETYYFYKNNMVYFSFVDIESDGLPEYAYYYDRDQLVYSEKYNIDKLKSKVAVETIKYKFGYPNLKAIKHTSRDLEDFNKNFETYYKRIFQLNEVN